MGGKRTVTMLATSRLANTSRRADATGHSPGVLPGRARPDYAAGPERGIAPGRRYSKRTTTRKSQPSLEECGTGSPSRSSVPSHYQDALSRTRSIVGHGPDTVSSATGRRRRHRPGVPLHEAPGHTGADRGLTTETASDARTNAEQGFRERNCAQYRRGAKSRAFLRR